MNQFAKETALDHVATADNVARFEGVCSDAWSIGGNPNGGYLLACAVSAARNCSPHQRLASASANYLRPLQGGEPMAAAVQTIRSGRSFTTVVAELSQHDKVCLHATLVFSDEPTSAPERELTLPPSEVAAPDECIDRSTIVQGVPMSLLSRIDVRVDPADLHPDTYPPNAASWGFDDAHTAQTRGWIRFSDGAAPSEDALILFADAFPPSVIRRYGQVGWVPTVQLTLHVRRSPAPGWVQAHFEVDDLMGGQLIETGSLWDSEGQLVARVRQLGLLRAN